LLLEPVVLAWLDYDPTARHELLNGNCKHKNISVFPKANAKSTRPLAANDTAETQQNPQPALHTTTAPTNPQPKPKPKPTPNHKHNKPPNPQEVEVLSNHPQLQLNKKQTPQKRKVKEGTLT
jgi:hypothetical protein